MDFGIAYEICRIGGILIINNIYKNIPRNEFGGPLIGEGSQDQSGRELWI